MNTFKDSKAFQIATTMPELSHWPDKPNPFDPANSQVLAWLWAQPTIADYARAHNIPYASLASHFNRRVIKYDQETKTWAGDPEGMTTIREIAKAKEKRIKSGKPLMFEVQYSGEVILENLRLEMEDGFPTEGLRVMCQEDSKMSNATFYRLLKKLERERKIRKDGNNWIII